MLQRFASFADGKPITVVIRIPEFLDDAARRIRFTEPLTEIVRVISTTASLDCITTSDGAAVFIELKPDELVAIDAVVGYLREINVSLDTVIEFEFEKGVVSWPLSELNDT